MKWRNIIFIIALSVLKVLAMENWNLIFNAPIDNVVCSTKNDSTLYVTVFGSIYLSKDYGKNFIELKKPYNEQELYAFDACDNVIIAAPRMIGNNKFFVISRDEGATWDSVYALKDQVYAVAISRSNPDIIFVSTWSGNYKSVNSGGNWTKINSLPGSNGNSIAISPNNSNKVLAMIGDDLYKTSNGYDFTYVGRYNGYPRSSISFTKFNDNRVLVTGSMGDNIYLTNDYFSTKKAFNTGYSEWPTCSVINPLSGDCFIGYSNYYGRSGGVRRLLFNDNKWKSDGLDGKEINDLDIDINAKYIYAAVSGEGLYRAKLPKIFINAPELNDTLFSEQVFKISWDYQGDVSGRINIDYSTNNGITWKDIASNININDRYYYWRDIPIVNYENCYIKISDIYGYPSTISKKFLIIWDQFQKINNVSIANYNASTYSASWIDYNNDDLMDLFITNYNWDTTKVHKNELFKNVGHGKFVKIENNITDLSGNLNSWADFNNDGLIDLFLGDFARNYLYLNKGSGNFDLAFDESINDSILITKSISWTDVNKDGYLDFYLANGSKGNIKNNFLFINQNAEKIKKVYFDDNAESNFASWADINNDGLEDLFIANLDTVNYLYINDGDSSLKKVNEPPFSVDNYHSVGSCWGDYNNDGLLDLYIYNRGETVFSESRNLLYKNLGNGKFKKITNTITTQNAASYINASWIDVNNDGYLDLYVVSQYRSDPNQPYCFLFLNNGDETFTPITNSSINNISGSLIKGAAWSDYDNDGFIDVFVYSLYAKNYLFKNKGNSNNWLEVKCEGIISNKSAIGAKVKIKANINNKNFWQLREISAQSSKNTQNSLIAHFGLGKCTLIDSLVVEWPSGIIQCKTNVSVNKFIKIVEDTTLLTKLKRKKEYVPYKISLLQNYPNPFNPTTTIRYAIPKTGNVTLTIYNLLGQKVRTLVKTHQPAGQYNVPWNGRDEQGNPVASGVYVYKLRVKGISGDRFEQVKKMVLMK